jgi:hypothetical protein
MQEGKSAGSKVLSQYMLNNTSSFALERRIERYKHMCEAKNYDDGTVKVIQFNFS